MSMKRIGSKPTRRNDERLAVPILIRPQGPFHRTQIGPRLGIEILVEISEFLLQKWSNHGAHIMCAVRGR